MRRGFVLSLGFVLLATACAGSQAEAGRSRPDGGPSTFSVTPNDDGRAVTMHIGDDLIVGPGQSSPSPSSVAWSILSYPKDVLLASGDLEHGPPFRFVARHAGVGKLRFSFGPACGGPGPLPGNGTNCALAGSGAGQGPAVDGVAVRLVTITVRVYGQGVG